MTVQTRSRLAPLVVALLAGSGLTACASSGPISINKPQYPIHAPPEQAAAPAPGRQANAPAPTEGRYKVGLPYEVRGVTYTPAEQPNYDETGVASWYGETFHAQ